MADQRAKQDQDRGRGNAGKESQSRDDKLGKGQQPARSEGDAGRKKRGDEEE